MRPFLKAAVLAFAWGSPVCGDQAIPSFFGPAGAILTPSAETLGRRHYALSLRYREHRNYIGASYSPLNSLEVGAIVVDPSRPGVEPTEFGFHLKCVLLRESRWTPAIAIGTGIWDVVRWQHDGHYVVGLKRIRLPWPSQAVKLSAGYGRGLYDGVFASLSVPLHPWVTGVVEFDGSYPNGVARITLPRGFSVDVGSLNWTLGVGATYGAEW